MSDELDTPQAGPGWGVPLTRDASAGSRILAEFEAEEEQSPIDRVHAILDSARHMDRACVKLFRVLPGVNKYEWCEDYGIEEFEAMGFRAIRERWGPGEYEARLYATNPETGKFSVRAKPRIPIAADPSAKPAAQPAPVGADPALVQIMRQMSEGQAAILAALSNRPDPRVELQNLVSLAATMRQLFGNDQPSAKNSISDIVTAIKELRSVSEELSPRRENEIDSESPMALIPPILDLVGKLAPGAQSPNSGALVPVVTLPQTMAVNPAQVSQGQPSPAPVNVSSASEQMQVINELKLHLANLVKMAEARAPYADGANYVYEKLPDELIEVMANPAWWQMLSGVAPEVKPHENWFANVQKMALGMFESDSSNQQRSGG